MDQDGAEYFGIDIGGTPDLRIDLEKIDRLPFDDDQFDCVVAGEVLEPLDSLHRVFCELVRVSRAHILISLPNCWRTLRSRLPRGYRTPYYYGLSAERPQDRHKWFFNVFDVVAFMEEQTRRLPVQVVEFTALAKNRSFPIRLPKTNKNAISIGTPTRSGRFSRSGGDEAVSGGVKAAEAENRLRSRTGWCEPGSVSFVL